jgi:RNA polymerase sigma factor (sigma-70 family)
MAQTVDGEIARDGGGPVDTTSPTSDERGGVGRRWRRRSVAPSGAARHDAAGFEELFRRHERELGLFLVQITSRRGLAEDILQETFLSALGARTQLDDVRDARAWLYAIARNHALEAMRSARREEAALERVSMQRERSAPDPAEAVAVRDLLARHLGPDERTLLVLRYLHGFNADELGAMSGLSAVAVRQRLSRAARTIARAADQEGISRREANW